MDRLLGYILTGTKSHLQESELVGVAKAWLRVTVDTLWGSLNSCPSKADARLMADCYLADMLGY